jgi:hypothetical protein
MILLPINSAGVLRPVISIIAGFYLLDAGLTTPRFRDVLQLLGCGGRHIFSAIWPVE